MESNREDIMHIKSYLEEANDRNRIHQKELEENRGLAKDADEVIWMVRNGVRDNKAIEKSRRMQQEEENKRNKVREARKIKKAKQAKQKKFTRGLAGVLSILTLATGAVTYTVASVEADENNAKQSYSHRISDSALNINVKNAKDRAEAQIESFLYARQVKNGHIDGFFRTGDVYMVRTQIYHGNGTPDEACYPVRLTSEQIQALKKIEVLQNYLDGKNVKQDEIEEAMISINTLMPTLEEQASQEKEEKERKETDYTTQTEDFER